MILCDKCKVWVPACIDRNVLTNSLEFTVACHGEWERADITEKEAMAHSFCLSRISTTVAFRQPSQLGSSETIPLLGSAQ